MNILIVDDDAANRALLTEFLDLIGHTTVDRDDGSKVVACLQDEAIDIIFMDCKMPGMDGLTATREVRAYEQAVGRIAVPIIGLSGEVTDENREQCAQAGMTSFLGKPFELDALEALVNCIDASQH